MLFLQQQQQQQHPADLDMWCFSFALKASDFVAMALVLVVDWLSHPCESVHSPLTLNDVEYWLKACTEWGLCTTCTQTHQSSHLWLTSFHYHCCLDVGGKVCVEWIKYTVCSQTPQKNNNPECFIHFVMKLVYCYQTASFVIVPLWNKMWSFVLHYKLIIYLKNSTSTEYIKWIPLFLILVMVSCQKNWVHLLK